MIEIDLRKEKSQRINLPFSGSSPNGDTMSIDSICMKKNGKPWIPISGEFQFSRYSETLWEKQLRKMKAGGIEAVASYIFWIHHEEERGKYRFDGCRNLRKFAELCQKVGLLFIPRVGPWVTAECMNGGFPEWVFDLEGVKEAKHGNTPDFMGVLREYFEKLYEQLQGLLYKDGGPIFSLQVENEFTPHRALSVEDGVEYMHNIKKMLIEIGFDVPFFTRTAWNRAIFCEDEMLPLFGAYCDAPWDWSVEDAPALDRFLLTDQRTDDIFNTSIEANDFKEKLEDSDLNKIFEMYKKQLPTPYLTVELGGGMQPSLHRRIVSEKDDTEALTVAMLARGANSLGYYIYHGGTHPTGINGGNMSSTPNGRMAHEYPHKSYDFGAPLGEDTMPKYEFFALKRRLLFVQEFGHILAECETTFPKENATELLDLTSPRFTIRYDKETDAGFLFINNHVRMHTMPKRTVKVKALTDNGEIELPAIPVFNHEMRIIPFNMPLDGGKIVKTNAQPLTKAGNCYYFYTNEVPEYEIVGDVKVITLTDNESLKAYKFDDVLYLSDEILYQEDGKLLYEGLKNEANIEVFDKDGNRSSRTYSTQKVEQEPTTFELISEDDEKKTYKVDFSKMNTNNVEDVLMTVNYKGDKARIYKDGEFISDFFTTGQEYRMTLKRFDYPSELTIEIYKSVPRHERYFDLPVEHGFELKDVILNSIYKMEVK